MKKVFFSLAAASLFAFASCSSEIECDCSIDSDMVDFSIEFETEEDDCYEGLVSAANLQGDEASMDAVREAYDCKEL